jgi:hypothetical protein
MERINYAAGSVLTGDDIAHALVEYSKALARAAQSDNVTFPVLLESGDVATAEVLIGPASQIMNVPEPNDHDDLSDADLVDELVRKTDALGLSHPQSEDAFEDQDSFGEF